MVYLRILMKNIKEKFQINRELVVLLIVGDRRVYIFKNYGFDNFKVKEEIFLKQGFILFLLRRGIEMQGLVFKWY